jgi:hypothetical protein
MRTESFFCRGFARMSADRARAGARAFFCHGFARIYSDLAASLWTVPPRTCFTSAVGADGFKVTFIQISKAGLDLIRANPRKSVAKKSSCPMRVHPRESVAKESSRPIRIHSRESVAKEALA